MLLRILSVLAVLAFGVQVWAIDTTGCPSQINFHAAVSRVYKSSTYRNIPGWEEARTTLKALAKIETQFSLAEKRAESCVYEDGTRNQATLSTFTFSDRGGELVSEVQLAVGFKIVNSSYVLFVPIAKFDQNEVVAGRKSDLKIKTRLFVAKTNRWSNLNLGIVSVTLN